MLSATFPPFTSQFSQLRSVSIEPQLSFQDQQLHARIINRLTTIYQQYHLRLDDYILNQQLSPQDPRVIDLTLDTLNQYIKQDYPIEEDVNIGLIVDHYSLYFIYQYCCQLFQFAKIWFNINQYSNQPPLSEQFKEWISRFLPNDQQQDQMMNPTTLDSILDGCMGDWKQFVLFYLQQNQNIDQQQLSKLLIKYSDRFNSNDNYNQFLLICAQQSNIYDYLKVLREYGQDFIAFFLMDLILHMQMDGIKGQFKLQFKLILQQELLMNLENDLISFSDYVILAQDIFKYYDDQIMGNLDNNSQIIVHQLTKKLCQCKEDQFEQIIVLSNWLKYSQDVILSYIQQGLNYKYELNLMDILYLISNLTDNQPLNKWFTNDHKGIQYEFGLQALQIIYKRLIEELEYNDIIEKLEQNQITYSSYINQIKDKDQLPQEYQQVFEPICLISQLREYYDIDNVNRFSQITWANILSYIQLPMTWAQRLMKCFLQLKMLSRDAVYALAIVRNQLGNYHKKQQLQYQIIQFSSK